MENYIIEMETVKRQYINDKQNLKRYFNLFIIYIIYIIIIN